VLQGALNDTEAPPTPPGRDAKSQSTPSRAEGRFVVVTHGSVVTGLTDSNPYGRVRRAAPCPGGTRVVASQLYVE